MVKDLTVGLRGGLRARLLLLTVIFIMVIEVLVYVPSIAQFRNSYIEQRLIAAQIAALSLEEAPDNMVSPALQNELLNAAEIRAVIIIRGDSRQLILRQNMPSKLADRLVQAEMGGLDLVKKAFETLYRGGEGFVQIAGPSSSPRFQSVQIVMSEKPLYDRMITYSWQFLGSSLIIALFTGFLIYFSISYLLIAPLNRVTESMAAFRRKPEDSTRTLEPSERGDELGVVEQELSKLQSSLHTSLKEKTHLANLGTAISKINHDLRNILATAQLSSDRLTASTDPTVKALLPRLLGSIDRAISLCENTLKYGKAEERTPQKSNINLRELMEEVALSLGLDDQNEVQWNNNVGKNTPVFADPDHLFRIMVNLGRNAVRAMAEGGTLTISAEPQPNDTMLIRFEDTGPGVPDNVREKLFMPFVGGPGGGSGLGLAIVKELVDAHGGEVSLEKSDANGTCFCVCLPNESTGKN